ncbi:MAG: hypothetical protein ACPG6P_01690 [Akkermansiaceae bacterium]
MKTTNTIATAIIAITCLTSLVSCSNSGNNPTSSISSVKPYTKNTCIVTDNKLGSMGDPISYIHKGQEVKFCCKPCVKKFKANPEKYLSKL